MGRARPTGSGDAPGRPRERRSRVETGAGPAAPAFPSPVSGVVGRLARGAARFARAAGQFAGASAARPAPWLRAASCLLAAVFTVLLLGAEAARAQTDTLVSNVKQTRQSASFSLAVGNGAGVNVDGAVAFTTGSNAGGYLLSEVDVRIERLFDTPTLVVSVYNTDSGRPSSSLHVLGNPSSLRSGEMNTFTARAGARAGAEHDIRSRVRGHLRGR